MASSRSKAQRAKRSFCTRRQGIIKKLHEINTLTEAKVPLVGIYKGKTFCYEEDTNSILPRFGIEEKFSDRFGPDDVELVHERNGQPKDPARSGPELISYSAGSDSSAPQTARGETSCSSSSATTASVLSDALAASSPLPTTTSRRDRLSALAMDFFGS